MIVVDVGVGPPVVVIPGIQGRWEWMRPGVEALAERCRVITFSLCDEPSSGGRFDERSGFASYVDQVRDALDQCGLETAAICGVSYGGLIAAAFAARHPERASALVLVSALPPTWAPDARVRTFMRAPRLMAMLFWLGSPFRLHREIAAAVPRRLARLRISLAYGWCVLANRPGATRMSHRVQLLLALGPTDLSGLRTPTLVVTGEPALDRVVPVHATLEYATLIPHAHVVTLERTGHVGFVTRPLAFADLVVPFVTAHPGVASNAVASAVKRAPEGVAGPAKAGPYNRALRT